MNNSTFGLVDKILSVVMGFGMGFLVGTSWPKASVFYPAAMIMIGAAGKIVLGQYAGKHKKTCLQNTQEKSE